MAMVSAKQAVSAMRGATHMGTGRAFARTMRKVRPLGMRSVGVDVAHRGCDSGVARSWEGGAVRRTLPHVSGGAGGDGGLGGGSAGGGRGGGGDWWSWNGGGDDVPEFGKGFRNACLGAVVLVLATERAAAAKTEAKASDGGGVDLVRALQEFIEQVISSVLSHAKNIKGEGMASPAAVQAERTTAPYSGLMAATLLAVGKVTVAWCARDSESSAASIDLGFLLLLGSLGAATLRSPALKALNPVLVEAAVAHIVFEMLFNGLLIRILDPESTYSMPPSMWIHHIASVIAGTICMVTKDADYNSLGTKLAITEITTFLPVAFRQARLAGKLKGNRSSVLGALMPLAFIWRTWWNVKVLGEFAEKSRMATSPHNAIVRSLGLGSTFAVLACNTLWTYRILEGVKKIFRRKRDGRRKGNGHKTPDAESKSKPEAAAAENDL